MEKEIKPLESGTAEVSTETAPSIHRAAAKKTPLTPLERVHRYREREKKKKLKAAYTYDSTLEPSKTEAKKILEVRIQNNHVLDVVYESLLRASEQLGITANCHVFQNGILAALKSYDQKEAQTIAKTSDEPVSGELLNHSELFALYDASIAWREEISFEEFLQIRQNCKRDCFYLGKEILQKDFADCHRVWADFFPKFDPTTLPPQYTQRQAIQWLDSQSIKKDFLLMASRNSFKSSFNHIWLLTLILCLPDVRILLVSETKPLSKDFIAAIRGYFETDKNSRFQQLFPEFVIPVGDGSVLSLEVPLARLRLAQSIESTSMDSAVAGRRADVIVFDDPISDKTVGNETQRLASIAKHDSLKKLREVGGLSVVLMTPWHEADLGAELLRRNLEDDDKPLAFRIDAAWILKTEFVLNDEGKPRGLREIKEHMVTLLFPERLSWKFLKAELRANPAFFASQNLCIFPRDEDADIRCTFDETKLREHVKPMSFFSSDPISKVCLSIDTAFSTAASADFSCIACIKIVKHEDQDAAVVWDVDLGRWPYSELAVHIVQSIERNRPTEVVIEKQGPWETLQREIMKQALYRNVVLPHIYFKNTTGGGTAPRAKSTRVKALEPLLADDQLWFVQAHWTDQCLEQLRRFDGLTRSSATRKDDFPDALAIGIQTYFPYHDGRKPIEKSEDQKAAEESAMKEARLRAMYARMFGNNETAARQPEVQYEEPDSTSPLFRGIGSALRRRN